MEGGSFRACRMKPEQENAGGVTGANVFQQMMKLSVVSAGRQRTSDVYAANCTPQE
jgi:hypothetical protein